MKFIDRERRRVVEARDRVLGDPGGGVYRGRPRDFVLADPEANLWGGLRRDIRAYFDRHEIAWHGGEGGSLGHLLSSQVACVNHLGALRVRGDAVTALLQGIDPEVASAEPVPEPGADATAPAGFVAFEFIGLQRRLMETTFTRGANCTSVDAAMVGRLRDGGRRLYLIEWKYAESYRTEDLWTVERAKRYDHLIADPGSPFVAGTDLRALYYEPFYQMMRQTLLGWLIVRHRDLGCDSFVHLHVLPEGNREFHDRVTSPGLSGRDVGEAWRSVLKEPERHRSVTPESLLAPVATCPDTASHLGYLRDRYWA